MMKRISQVVLLGCWAVAGMARASESPQSERTALDSWPRIARQQDQPTLPEIEVRPPVAPNPRGEAGSVGEGSALEPADGTSGVPASGAAGSEAFADQPLSEGASPTAPPSPSASARSDVAYSEAFESLDERVFGGTMSNISGLNSIFRGETDLFSTPRLGTIIDRQDLDRRQATTMFRALQNEVGVLLQQTGNGQLSPFIRGLTGQQILILVDGIRMNTSILRPGPNQYAATIDPGMVERIEVIRGSESALWGSDAIGGVINVVTRSADPLRGDYLSPQFQQFYSTAEASTYTRAGFSTWAGATGITGGVSYLDVGNLDIGGGLGRQPGTDYTQYAADIKLQRMLSADHLLTVALQHFEQQDLGRSDRFLPFVLGPAPDGTVPIQRPTFFDPQQRDLIYARIEGLPAEELPFADLYSITLSGMRTKEASVVDRYASNAPDAIPTRREVGEFDDLGWGTILSFSKDLGDFGRLTYGGDYYHESINAERVRIDNPTAPGATAVPIDPQYPDDAQADRVGVYSSWFVPITDRLESTTSVRYENIHVSGTPNFDTIGPLFFQRSYQDWTASVGLSYLLTDELRMVGGYYEGFRAPTIDDLTADKTFLQNNQSTPIIGNIDIEPEHTKTYEVGLKFNFDRLRLQVTEYWIDFDSFISRDVVGGTRFLTNQEASMNGTELTGEYLIRDNLALYGNFFYTYGTIVTSDEPISRIPPTQGILGLRYRDLDRATYFDLFAWMVDRADRYQTSNLSDVRFIPGGTPGYATLNMRMGRAFGRCDQHQISLSLENITDKYYRVLGSGVDGPGFNAVLGYQFSM